MALKAAAFARRIQVVADRALSPAAQSARLATVAKREVAALIATGRASPKYRRFVDGVEGAPEEAVRPANDGLIVYRFTVLGPVAAFALAFLVSRSPLRSGAYARSFYLGIDGRFVPMASFNPDKLTGTVTEIVIGNTQPYSRKVDVQLTGNRRLHFSVPPGLYDDAVAALKARYGAIIDVRRVYTMNFPGQWRIRHEQFHKSGRRAGRSRQRAGSLVESPALIITPRR